MQDLKDVCYFSRKAVEEARHPDLQGLTIYVAQDCTGMVCDVLVVYCIGSDPSWLYCKWL